MKPECYLFSVPSSLNQTHSSTDQKFEENTYMLSEENSNQGTPFFLDDCPSVKKI